VHFISLENIRISFLFSSSKYRKCRHCAKTIAIMAKSMTNRKALLSSLCFTHGREIRGAARYNNGKTAVLPRFGASRIKNFSFTRPPITRSWSCLIKTHCGAPAEVVFLKCSALKFSPPRSATVSLQAYGGRAVPTAAMVAAWHLTDRPTFLLVDTV
jgi:hypothetical protein